ncbi:MAG: hypothetical protein K8H86_02630, partial [Ignavibacteriaceae bacterium]|nr:hypothetical protein [Ignavibacteriaceae bacterium]
YTTAEVQARNEGYADYFTCSFTNDYLFGEWYAFSVPYMRIANNSSSVFNYKNWNNINFNNDYNLPSHRNGMIWSGACWDLRNALGQTIADKIIFGGLINISGTYDFESAMYGIISADIVEYSGTHIATINTIFNNRCILNPSAPIGLSISGSVGQHPVVSWTRNNELDVSGYEVYRSLNGYTYQLVQSINKPFITTYTDLASTIGVPGDPTVCYKIKAVDKYGNRSNLSSAACTYDGGLGKQNEPKTELSFKLDEAYPNPFNPSAKLSFQIPENASIKLEIYNSIGQKVADLTDGIYEPGSYNFNFNGSKIAGGIYYARFTAISSSNGKVFVKTNKLVLIK